MIETIANVRVRFSETDAMGIVYHANYFPWLEIARTKLLAEVGLPYFDLQNSGYMLPVIDAQMSYKKPAKYDDEIEIRAMMKTFSPTRIRIDYEVRCGNDLLTHGYTVHAFANGNGAAIRPPLFFVEKLKTAFGE